jgi:hypothetical protein
MKLENKQPSFEIYYKIPSQENGEFVEWQRYGPMEHKKEARNKTT